MVNFVYFDHLLTNSSREQFSIGTDAATCTHSHDFIYSRSQSLELAFSIFDRVKLIRYNVDAIIPSTWLRADVIAKVVEMMRS